MNWLQWITRILSLTPVVVAGVEAIHTEAKSGAVKKQMALDALGLSAGVAQVLVPAHLQPAVGAATQLASQAIDNVVSLMNAIKTPAQLPAETAAAATAGS